MIMRNEYPRPEFVRKEWLNLNGTWDFYVGDKSGQIEVPYVCQSKLSGIGEKITEDIVIYERKAEVPKEWKGRSIRLNFGAVDYGCRVWVNGRLAGCHMGGQTPFSFDVTDSLTWEEERIRVEVWDPLKDESIARGKQFWEEESRFIWYTPSTGIWQTVWMEPVEETHFEWIHFTPDIDEGTVRIDYELSLQSALPCIVEIAISFQNELVFCGRMVAKDYQQTIIVDVFQKKALNGSFHFTGAYWSPETPNLYEVVMTAGEEAKAADQVRTYFGMRKVEARNGQVYLNHRPYYQKLVLDQGYWKDSLITAPDDNAYIEDIQKAKAMGFNGCRKHEKVEDPRFLYWADKLGFLVWEAMASFWVYTPKAASAFTKEWIDVIHRDYNHPSIVVWGMLNESWGVPGIRTNQSQQSFAKSLYHLAHSLDPTRLVISNDGWEMTDTDICAFHSYQHGKTGDIRQQERFRESLKSVAAFGKVVEKPLFADGTRYEGQPVMLTEFGGISVCGEEAGGWGYTDVKESEFLEEFQRIIDAISQSEQICGYCYTQLADVEQEMNGLLTREHQYKFDPEQIKDIQDLC